MSLPVQLPPPALSAHHASDAAARPRFGTIAAGARVGALAQWLQPLAPALPILAAGERFLDAESATWLSLPVVEGGRPVGSISRHELMQRVYIKPFGRELHGKRPVASIMHPRPLVLDATATIEDASRRIAAQIRQPITEDFIVVDGAGRYAGAGKVLDVLAAMEGRLGARTQELEQANRRIRASQAQLIQSEKMASLGQMVAGIAHEINTPLGYVRNNVEMTRAALAEVRALVVAGAGASTGDGDGMLPGAAAGEFARRAATPQGRGGGFDAAALEDLAGLLDDTLFGVGQIAELVGTLKDFSRVDQARSERVDVHRLIESALKIAGSLLRRKNIEIVRAFGAVPECECAPAQINQVLLNLITNAAQAVADAGGRITLRTQAAGNHALIAVEDNGKGIAPEHLPRVFDPFFTTKPAGQGTGLGLSICWQIVEQHRGRICAVSQAGAGTRFLVALPLVQRASRPATA